MFILTAAFKQTTPEMKGKVRERYDLTVVSVIHICEALDKVKIDSLQNSCKFELSQYLLDVVSLLEKLLMFRAMRLNTSWHSEQHPSFLSALTAFFGSSVVTSPHEPVSEPLAVRER